MKPWLLTLAAVLACVPAAGARAGEVGLIEMNGTIGPAAAGYIARAIHVADARHDACLVIQLDTPGGLLDSTKEIVQTFYAAAVPTVVYVAPSGASATSAGCFITMAADVAAMAPNTSIGAAHPVMALGGADKLDEVMDPRSWRISPAAPSRPSPKSGDATPSGPNPPFVRAPRSRSKRPSG